jgi:hypothetical protein
MMKINGNLSILVSKECTRIEIKDSDAGTRFLSIKLDPETFCALLGRLADVSVELEVRGLEKVGKKMEIDKLEFEIPPHDYASKDHLAIEEAKRVSPAGWIPDGYFNSQDSYFSIDGKDMARCTIRRWV